MNICLCPYRTVTKVVLKPDDVRNHSSSCHDRTVTKVVLKCESWDFVHFNINNRTVTKVVLKLLYFGYVPPKGEIEQ